MTNTLPKQCSDQGWAFLKVLLGMCKGCEQDIWRCNRNFVNSIWSNKTWDNHETKENQTEETHPYISSLPSAALRCSARLSPLYSRASRAPALYQGGLRVLSTTEHLFVTWSEGWNPAPQRRSFITSTPIILLQAYCQITGLTLGPTIGL